MIEFLENRIVPAAVFTFTDVDGDLVKITTSKGANADLNNNTVTVVGGQLRLLDLTADVFQNTDLTIAVVKKSATGDGIVNIGRIDATGRDLGSVKISGDLSDLDCGDTTTATTALKSLSVRSLGLHGNATQGGTGDLESNIAGGVGKLIVQRNVVDAHFFANGGVDGNIGSVFVGGSVLGGASQASGMIQASGSMGSVQIRGDLVGGAGFFSGAINVGEKLTSVTIGGSLIGGANGFAGYIVANTELGVVKIVGDAVGGSGEYSGGIQGGKIGSASIGGSLLGGAGKASGNIFSGSEIGSLTIGENVRGVGENSARIYSVGKLASLQIGGSLLGGQGKSSGVIVSDGTLGLVKIGHDVKGGAGNESGKIDAAGAIGSVSIGGSLLGGAGHQDTILIGNTAHRGQIFSGGALGPVKIGGNVSGGEGRSTASIESKGAIAGINIGGSLRGSSGDHSAHIVTGSNSDLGPVTIRHDVRGGDGYFSGSILSNGKLGNVTIGGSLLGGFGARSGSVATDSGASAIVKIGHDVAGGSGEVSGFIGGAIDVTIGGSLIGGSAHLSGGIYTYGADLKSVRIGHDMLGGSIPGQHAALDYSGYIESEFGIGKINIGGSIVSGTNAGDGLTHNATIRAGRTIGELNVKGDIIGNVTPAGDTTVVISAFGQDPSLDGTSDVAIGKIKVGGRVEWAQIFAGYDRDLVGRNADAQIGSVSVGGDWVASSIIAGAKNLGQDQATGGSGANADNIHFGDLSDRKVDDANDLDGVFSKIGSIAIGGQVFGTAESFRSGDQFGFVAEEIGKLKVGARTFTPAVGPHNDGAPIQWRSDSLGADVNVHEIGSGISSAIELTTSAKLISPNTVTYLDKDGDRVTVKFTKGLLTAANVNDVFHFDDGAVNDNILNAQQLRFLDLRVLQSNGIGVTFSVVRSSTGDGLVHVGAIESTGYDVGLVKIPGDLGRIDAGDATLTTKGVGALNVRTFGRFGFDTQGGAIVGYSPSLESNIVGGLGSLKVAQDFANAFLTVDGSIGSIQIGGSLIGGEGLNSGAIKTSGLLGL